MNVSTLLGGKKEKSISQSDIYCHNIELVMRHLASFSHLYFFSFIRLHFFRCLFGVHPNSYHQPIFVSQPIIDKCCLVFALFYFLTSKAKFGFLKNEKDFQFKLLKQVWKLNLIIIRDNLQTYQHEES
jgi:hypothetical protein